MTRPKDSEPPSVPLNGTCISLPRVLAVVLSGTCLSLTLLVFLPQKVPLCIQCLCDQEIETKPRSGSGWGREAAKPRSRFLLGHPGVQDETSGRILIVDFVQQVDWSPQGHHPQLLEEISIDAT